MKCILGDGQVLSVLQADLVSMLRPSVNVPLVNTSLDFSCAIRGIKPRRVVRNRLRADPSGAAALTQKEDSAWDNFDALRVPKLSDVLREMALFMMAQALVPVLATMVQLNLLLEGSPLRVLTTFKARGHQPAKAVSKKVTEKAPVRVGPNILPTETAKSLATTDELWTQVSCATSTKSTSQFKNSAARAESDPTSRLASKRAVLDPSNPRSPLPPWAVSVTNKVI
ncbi:hypothetical protein I4F81_003330 [Pyropia yezoensis]|uniref:Uncharacterized protein n=1 Tax=Pyropia yezoensis TaxID=2788 RepID=A0ACC3BTA7_PYRYE|nr:hypothetical protein I4F81_003330 [Neopyropia yezoensis]